MNFNECVQNNNVKIVRIDKFRASSLFASSRNAISTAKTIQLTQVTSKTILRELYEGLREFCDALGYLYGYKFLNHESITYFLRDILRESSISIKFDRYRKLRNGINYYGEDINLETVKEAINDIPEMIKQLSKHN